MDAEALRCSYCGGALAEGARACSYCHSVVQARRCASCLHLSQPDAHNCAACGAELGLEPVAELDSLGCPACARPFVAVPCTGDGRLLHECEACGGQFLEHATLQAMVAERPRRPDLTGAQGSVPPASTAVRYRPCPVCRAMMNRKNFGDHSGIIVDVCKPHGVWFDAGELPRALAFIEIGGLETAAREEHERQRDELRRAREVHAAFEAATMSADDGFGGPPSLRAMLARMLFR